MKSLLRAGKLTFTAGPFTLGPVGPVLQIDGKNHALRAGPARRDAAVWRSAQVELTLALVAETKYRLRVTASLLHRGTRAVVLNRATLLAGKKLGLGPAPADVRILEQNAYTGRVRTPRQMLTGSDGLKALDGSTGAFVSQNHTLFYCPRTRSALLVGFETVDRWLPEICARQQTATSAGVTTANVDGAVTKSAGVTASAPVRVPAFREFSLGFDGGDYVLQPGETLALGDFVLESGSDPLALLDGHGRRIKTRNRFADPIAPLANWCSWYPYRLGTSEENTLATARAARAHNLHKLGLRFIQVDLGWEKDNIPSYFEENERFAHGLGWLSAGLRREGFDLGVWVGVLCIAESHPVAQEHPEWLLRGADGKPHNNYNWFWEPFCPIYALDVSHPGAQGWLRENFTRLAEKGVRFVKWDFAGVVTGKLLRGRHNPQFVNARAREAVRTAFRIAHEALDSQGKKAMMIDCSGTDYAAAGIAEINYANMDTGNAGLGWRHLREVYTSYACHLFKHHWALLQPSCLLVGLPGTLEEARVRATVTFMGAGHVDLGDDLTDLPEDRWAVLQATLPPNDRPATPVDLFHPVKTGTLPYLQLIKAKESKSGGKTAAQLAAADHAAAIPPPVETEPQGACVWSLPMASDWDEWHLVAFFNWTEPPLETGSNVSLARRFQVEFSRLGLPKNASYWAYEFWSGQYLGEVPRALRPAGTYRHPGDFGHPIQESGPGVLDIGFHCFAVKLVVLRKPRSHPWPLGTSFHQSGGRELRGVKWNAKTRTLSGQLIRPKGESGFIMFAVPGAGAVSTRKLPVIATGDVTKWSVKFQ
ncbi:MAG: alpha-galactosidase [Opitutaceae bacterium]|nr:alpha-galactosidase [Opitutaceae bacterium]